MKKGIITISIICSIFALGLSAKNYTFAQESKNESIETNVLDEKILSQEESKTMLEEKYKNLKFEYQGDEKTFPILKEKRLSGYVYLPINIDTDMGYFVDKNTHDVYSFHPSGYLQKI